MAKNKVDFEGKANTSTGAFAGTVSADVAAVAPSLATTSRRVDMQRFHPSLDPQLALYEVIRRSSDRVAYNRYAEFMKEVFCSKVDAQGDIIPLSQGVVGWQQSPFNYPLGLSGYSGMRSYLVVKEATEIFLQSQCGVWPTNGFGLPSNPLSQSNGVISSDAFRSDEREFGDGKDEPESPSSSASRRLERDAAEISEQKLEDLWFDYIRAAESGVDAQMPYIKLILRKLSGIPRKDEVLNGQSVDCYGVLDAKLKNPCMIELIWNYWMEQGMVVQSINALATRFQNRRSGPADVLARFDVDPLRPLNNLLWGYVQDEQNRLTVIRRVYEYDHHYGLRLDGRAVPPLQAADSRSKFLEAFHQLMRECSRYYRAVTNTFIVPDTYPALNALRELQIILTEGMHNQYGDLPSTARGEMLIQQWLMARPEMLQFVGQRTMVPHPEPWMGYVDTIRQLHGWGDTSVRHFRDLAICGEKILLAVRFGNWATQQSDIAASLFMSFFREEVQTYIHAYRAVTGVDLGVEDINVRDPRIFVAQPSELMATRAPARPIPAQVRGSLSTTVRTSVATTTPISPANPKR